MSDPDALEQLLNLIVDPVWYRARHPDVAARGLDPLAHFMESGLREHRDPNRWFDGAWYIRQYADVAASGEHPLMHYMAKGAALRRDPHPRFDAGWYADQHPEAAGNPMLFHLRVGAARGWLTERPVAIEDYLPSAHAPFPAREGIAVDIVVPVYRGLELTQRCLDSVLADGDRPAGRIIVVDDRSPEPKLSAWLATLAKSGAIVLLRNKTNLGFVASVNRGMTRAGDHDVVLLNNDTEVPPGWLRRLQAHAYAALKVASVSPLSNNGSICGYLSYEGGPIPDGMTLEGLDTACQTVNAGRSVAAPTTVGFCMYIRRAALDDVGLFDEQTFGKGYGEENDFCLRATARGWTHHIACDTFVRHEGGASFGAEADERITRAYAILTARFPEYSALVQRHVHDNESAPWRFAVTMSLFKTSGVPTILLISHDLDGGVRRHVQDLVARGAGKANFLVLEPATRGVALSVPALPGHPELVLAAERWRDIAAVARSAGVSRVHIHHLMGLDLNTWALIRELDVPFDVTVHDYFAICPQVTLLPWPGGTYCGEPGPAGCDACIANRPSHGATDILSWRLRWAWQFREADRVFAPSQDALDRLRRHGLGSRARLVPHEPVAAGPWPLHPPPRPGKKLRVAVLGVLASHKGAHVVAAVAMAADPAELEIQVLGEPEAPFPEAARARMKIGGPYREGALPSLLAKYRPHLIWFPAAWPETYSFTLSAAIDSGLPIVAPEIGAFPERLAGRPSTWVVPPSMDPAAWLTLFRTIAAAPKTHPSTRDALRRLPADLPGIIEPPPGPRRRATGLVNLRRPGGKSVVIIPETLDGGHFSPCAHIRLLRPLDHLAAGKSLDTTLADATEALHYRADVIATQRHAVPALAAAEALAAHARRTGATLLYDLDDDLLTVPPDHPEAAGLIPKAAVVERMIRLADVVRTSTAALAARIAPLARRVMVVSNALDERIWCTGPRRSGNPYRPVRILCMGTATHDGDFALILPALTEAHRMFDDRFQFDLIGVVADLALPAWIGRLAPRPHAMRSYAGFVHWVTSAGEWDVGLAPLADTPFNDSKSAIKTLDYAALGLATLASDVTPYRGSVADGPGGWLVPNDTDSWYAALSLMIRDPDRRRNLAAGGARCFLESGTLAAHAGAWQSAWPRLRDLGRPAMR
ncbi:MAG: glycosyltransferase [Acetobacteraceae bacterium]|nr:glycosyltransferase [Acetobacteraceae bacterium]